MKTVYRDLPQKQAPVWRRLFFFGVLFVCFFALVLGGGYQVIYFAPQAKARLDAIYYGGRVETAHRGNIRDKDGRPLAMNADQYHAVADLHRLRQIYGAADGAPLPQAKIEALADALLMTPAQVADKLASSRDFIYLKKQIPPAQAQAVRRLDIRGIYPQYKSQRFYPNAFVAAHLIGHTDYEGVGRSGVESARQNDLSAQDGNVLLLRTTDGVPLRELDYEPAVDGADLRLSLDSRLQFFAYEALEKSVIRHGAQAGAVILMDVASGGVLAIASYPSFNPNRILQMDDTLQNRAISDVVEPGSTAKPLVAALALDNGLVAEDEIFPTQKPLRVAGNLVVRDTHIREDLDLAGVIAKSSNIGAVLLARRLGEEKLWRLYDQLGFGAGKVLNMAEENTGRLSAFEGWRRSDFATHAYGYGFSVNLLQLLRAYTVFANDGVLVQPRLETASAQVALPRVLSAQTARAVRRMMEAVTTPYGTARRAAIGGYKVAGKTGTTYKWNGGAYDREKPRAFFIGMAPATSPRYLAVVMIDEPRRNGFTGGAAAAPVFQAVMRRALLLGGVPPDNLNPAEQVALAE